jgi:hypothetical protein
MGGEREEWYMEENRATGGGSGGEIGRGIQ